LIKSVFEAAMTRAKVRFATLLLATACLFPVTALAQDARLETQRAAVFAQLLNAPADRALMLDYARLSVRLRDFEAAAATLERFLDLEPDNAAARLELATAYFALGAYEVAEYHLATASASGGLTPGQLTAATRYRDETAARQGPHQITGRIAIGQASARETDESGSFGTAQLDWRFDMGGPDAHDWLTQLAFSRYSPEDGAFADRQSTRLRSGPEFRLTGDAYGPRLQPYVEWGWVEEDDGSGTLEQDITIALGFAYQNAHNTFWTSHADVQFGRGDRDDGFGLVQDFEFRDIRLGLVFRPSRDTRIRGTLGWRDEDLDDGSGTYETSRTLRLEALHSFDTGWTALPRRWEARGWVARQTVEEGDVFGIADDYTDRGYGLGLRAFVTEDLFVEARGSRLDRDFVDPVTTDERETVYSLQIGWEF
jgi:tetratricopeptide (TPR) repeat protein